MNVREATVLWELLPEDDWASTHTLMPQFQEALGLSSSDQLEVLTALAILAANDWARTGKSNNVDFYRRGDRPEELSFTEEHERQNERTQRAIAEEQNTRYELAQARTERERFMARAEHQIEHGWAIDQRITEWLTALGFTSEQIATARMQLPDISTLPPDPEPTPQRFTTTPPLAALPH